MGGSRIILTQAEIDSANERRAFQPALHCVTITISGEYIGPYPTHVTSMRRGDWPHHNLVFPVIDPPRYESIERRVLPSLYSYGAYEAISRYLADSHDGRI